MARLSPWMIPSFDTISLLPKTIILIGSLYVFINMVENCGQRICILCNAEFRLNELNLLLASTNMTTSVCSSSNISFMECIAASAPDWRPVAICNGPAASWISFFITHPIHFPIILRITSPTPIGRTPGFLLRGISQHATRASTECGSTISGASNLANGAICPFSSLFSFLNLGLLRICWYCPICPIVKWPPNFGQIVNLSKVQLWSFPGTFC